MKAVFIGYGTGRGLDFKHSAVLPALDMAGFRAVEYDGDRVHLVPDEAVGRVVAFVHGLSDRDVTVDVEEYEPVT